MNTSVSDFNRNVVVKRLNDGTEQAVVELISEAVDKGITRIKRNSLVNELVEMLFTSVLSASSTAIGESFTGFTVMVTKAVSQSEGIPSSQTK